MYARIKSLLLTCLKVPHEPAPPHGHMDSLRVFRAGPNFQKLRLVRWGIGQLLAFAGIAFWVAVFVDVEFEVDARRRKSDAPATMTVDSFTKTMESVGREAAAHPPVKTKGKIRFNGSWYQGYKRLLVEIAMKLPRWAFPVLWVVKIVGIVAYFAQLPVTYLIARLDYELRWYMVTDRSLRIRHGVWKISESTMSFANIQQVVVSQGPVQRLLGLADVKVQSAGGGNGGHDSHGNPHAGEDMHLGLFHSVTNAPEIRDLILNRLRQFRESGLGDPEEKKTAVVAAIPAGSPPPTSADAVAAARELLAEARALRAQLG